MSIVLILGSGPGVVACQQWQRPPFDQIVAINNAWAVRSDWDVLIHPDDFPPQKRPTDLSGHQSIVTSADYVPHQNTFGGFVYAGGTMAFTASYWALGALKPKVIALLGCDMTYAGKVTHFYGTGTADPLRDDITLRSLEAKSARLMIKAAQAGCAVVNLSADPSRLIVPRSTPDALKQVRPAPFSAPLVAQAEAAEQRLGYFVASGKYWQVEDRFDATEIDALDALWLKAAQRPQTAP